MFLGKSLEVSLSATKRAASKKMCDVLFRLLSTTDLLPIRGEYKLWLYRNYIVSLLRFHLSVDLSLLVPLLKWPLGTSRNG